MSDSFATERKCDERKSIYKSSRGCLTKYLPEMSADMSVVVIVIDSDTVKPVKCFTCHERGHLSNDCKHDIHYKDGHNRERCNYEETGSSSRIRHVRFSGTGSKLYGSV